MWKIDRNWPFLHLPTILITRLSNVYTSKLVFQHKIYKLNANYFSVEGKSYIFKNILWYFIIIIIIINYNYNLLRYKISGVEIK